MSVLSNFEEKNKIWLTKILVADNLNFSVEIQLLKLNKWEKQAIIIEFWKQKSWFDL